MPDGSSPNATAGCGVDGRPRKAPRWSPGRATRAGTPSTNRFQRREVPRTRPIDEGWARAAAPAWVPQYSCEASIPPPCRPSPRRGHDPRRAASLPAAAVAQGQRHHHRCARPCSTQVRNEALLLRLPLEPRPPAPVAQRFEATRRLHALRPLEDRQGARPDPRLARRDLRAPLHRHRAERGRGPGGGACATCCPRDARRGSWHPPGTGRERRA